MRNNWGLFAAPVQFVGINQGPSHMEIMYNDNPPDEGGGPCLVEVGSRCHGGEGTWLPIAEECIGYTMVSITADVYLNGPIFDTLSPTHFPLMKYGMDCDLVSHASGIIRALPGEELIKQLPSYRSVDWEVHVGGFCHLTIDCFTRPGCVQMANASEEDLNRDFARLNYLEDNGLVLDFSIMCASAPTTGSIVVVDPYGAGTDLAAFALKWGYKLILVFTTQGSGDDSCPEKGKTHSHKSQTLLSQHGSHFKPTLMVQHSGDTEAAALANTLSVLKKQSETSPVLAILAGANSAVALVSKLSFALHTRCLGVDRTINICDKDFIQNEISTKTDLTTIKQRVCFSESDVKLFFADSNGAPIVLKSCKNGGGELIMLCHDVDEAVYAFNTIHNDKSVNGVGNNGAIAQEYIEGNEYIIDGVSRDSVIKFTAMWENQKGSINGGDFVPYSMRLVAGPTSEKSFVISEYARKAVQALGKCH